MTPNQAAAPENNPYRQSYAPNKMAFPKEGVLKVARAIPQKPIKSGWQKKYTSLPSSQPVKIDQLTLKMLFKSESLCHAYAIML